MAHKLLGLSLLTAFTTGAFLTCIACAFFRMAMLSAAVGMLVNCTSPDEVVSFWAYTILGTAKKLQSAMQAMSK